jgi:hypothetical protein
MALIEFHTDISDSHVLDLLESGQIGIGDAMMLGSGHKPDATVELDSARPQLETRIIGSWALSSEIED